MGGFNDSLQRVCLDKSARYGFPWKANRDFFLPCESYSPPLRMLSGSGRKCRLAAVISVQRPPRYYPFQVMAGSV